MLVATRSFTRFLSSKEHQCEINIALNDCDDLKTKLLDAKDSILKDLFRSETGNLPFGVCMLFEIIKYKKNDNRNMYVKNVKLFMAFLKNKLLQDKLRNNEEYNEIMLNGNFFGFSINTDNMSALKYSYDCTNVLNKIKDGSIEFYENYICNNDRFAHLFASENAKANKQISHTELMIVYWTTEYITKNYDKWIENACFKIMKLSPYNITYHDDFSRAINNN